MANLAFGKTDVGKKRTHNEDSLLIDNDLQLYAIADGMGGHAAGEVASATALQVVKDVLDHHGELFRSFVSDQDDKIREEILAVCEQSILKACEVIFEQAQQDKRRRGMGTTLSMMLVAGNGAFIGHVGDSRIYLLREDEVHQLTVDHTLVNEQLRRGAISKDEARKSTYKNVITRAVGIQESVRTDTLHLDVLPGDRFLLCSDGLHGYLKQGDLEGQAGRDPKDLPGLLVDLANERGGKDNISVICLAIDQGERDTAQDTRLRIHSIQEAPLFRYLSYREQVTVMNLTYTRTVRDGEIIIKEGDVGDEMFLLVKGDVVVLKGDQEIARLTSGSHFGEMALIDNSPRSATIRSIGISKLLVIGRNKFYGFIRKDTNAGIKMLWSFLQILTYRLRSTDERLREAQEELSIQEVKPEWILLDENN